MKAALVLVVMLAMLVALAPSDAAAQAPAPKVTITGLIDEVGATSRNLSMTHADFDATRGQDSEAYGRTRGRFDIIGELGKAKAVMGWEFDLIYGAYTPAVSRGECASPNNQPVAVSCRADGSSGGFGVDTDNRNTLELKWLYIEAPLTGPGSLLSFVPAPGTVRLGGQPHLYDLRPMFAYGDFAGANIDITLTPTFKVGATYAQWTTSLTGTRAAPTGSPSPNLIGPLRDPDWGLLLMSEVTPFRGLRILPMFTYKEMSNAQLEQAPIRVGFGGIPINVANFGGPGAARRGQQEQRYTVGFESDLRSGPLQFSPAAFYQFGHRPSLIGPTLQDATVSSWFIDVLAAYNLGPLRLELRPAVTSGNKATDNLRQGTLRDFQPFQSDNAYFIGYCDACGINSVDYLSSFLSFSNALALPLRPGYDRYGRAMLAAKAIYGLTPTLDLYSTVTPMWTLHKVDRSSTVSVASGLTPGNFDTRSSYLGTGLAVGLTYRFAPGLTFDANYAYLVAGHALDHDNRDAKDASIAAARVRFAF